jgi:hypothetical protein
MRAASVESRRHLPAVTTSLMSAETRGMLQLMAVGAALAGLGAAFVWSRRRLLRRWHMVVPAVVLLLAIPPAVTMGHDIRVHAGGDAAAWGRLGELIILMAVVPVICVAGGALLAAAIVLATYGWASPVALAQARREPWYAPLFRPRTREETLMRLYVSLGSMVVVGVLWLLGVRPGS